MKLQLHQWMALKCGQLRRRLVTQPHSEPIAQVYDREVSRAIEGADEVKPSAIVMLPRRQASVVVNLTVLVRVDAKRVQKFEKGAWENPIPNHDEVSTRVAGASVGAALRTRVSVGGRHSITGIEPVA